MNFNSIAKSLGLLVCIIGLTMIFSLFCGLYFKEYAAAFAILLSIFITLLLGGSLYWIGSRKKDEVYRKEALAIVGLGWLLCAAVGALPFIISRSIPHVIDAYFESMSGFTTTGASILTDIEALPKCILFWRSFTHWLGGMGIIVLFIAVLPFLGVGGRQMFKSEVPGPVGDALTPRIKETAIILWKIYLLFTVIETILLMIGGMPLWEACCHTFGTLATGGFSTRNESIAAFNSVYIESVIIIFMFLAGTNFSLHYSALRGNLKNYWRDAEWRAYAGLLLGAGICIILSTWLCHNYERFLDALRFGAFQTLALMTTTGYVTADFNQWYPGVKILLVALMFIGGCAGSTGGGMKVLRLITLVKTARHQLERIYSPRSVRKVKIGSTVIEEDVQAAVLGYFLLLVIIFVISSIVIALMGIDITTATTSVVASLNNIGPGLGLVGATGNYAFFPYPGKVLLTILMVMGRLELFSILVLFVPVFWQRR